MGHLGLTHDAAGWTVSGFEADLRDRLENLLNRAAVRAFEREDEFLVEFDDRVGTELGGGDAQQIRQGGGMDAGGQLCDFPIDPMALAVVARIKEAVCISLIMPLKCTTLPGSTGML